MIFPNVAGYLIAAMIGASASAVGTVWVMKNGEVRALNGKIAEMNAARERIEAQNFEVVTRYTQDTEQQRRKISKLQGEINANVKDISVCNYSIGAVRLLNSAYAGLPGGSTITNAKAATTSTITGRKIIERHIWDVGQYNECVTQLNALIDIRQKRHEKK